MTVHRITTAERRRRLAARHRLTAPGLVDDPVVAADSVLGLHASDPASVFLACLARMATPAISAVEDALYADRTLVRHHGMRRTMWVLPPARARLMHAAVTIKIARRERVRNLKALDASTDITDPEAWLDRGIDEIGAFLASSGPATSRTVGQALPHLAVPVGYGSGRHVSTLNAHTKLLQQAGFDGLVVRAMPTGTWISSEYLWSATDVWLGESLGGLETREAAAELIAGYLAAFGPVTETDLVWWSGDTKTLVRGALSDIGAVKVGLDGDQRGWVLPDDVAETPEPEPWVRLLPGLDPTPMGWKEREWFLPVAHHPRLFDRHGNVGPTIWADGGVVGGWIQRPDATVAFEVLEPVSSEHHDLLRAEIGRIEAALDGVVVRPRFPSRNQKPLLATS